MATLAQQADLLRTQLGLKDRSTIKETIDAAVSELGLAHQVQGMNLVAQASACMEALGVSNEQPAVPMAVVIADPVLPEAPAPVSMARGDGRLQIVRAWYGNEGETRRYEYGGVGKCSVDVTKICQRRVRLDELHLNPNETDQTLNWAFYGNGAPCCFAGGCVPFLCCCCPCHGNKAWHPPTPKMVAITYTYDGGATYREVTFGPKPSESFAVSITRNTNGRLVGRPWTESVTSQDIAGCWLLCGFPLFWELACKAPIGGDPNRYSETGIAFLCMGLPLPVGETWTRNPGTDHFRKDKDHNAVVRYSSGCYGNESGFIHKCKICG